MKISIITGEPGRAPDLRDDDTGATVAHIPAQGRSIDQMIIARALAYSATACHGVDVPAEIVPGAVGRLLDALRGCEKCLNALTDDGGGYAALKEAKRALAEWETPTKKER